MEPPRRRADRSVRPERGRSQGLVPGRRARRGSYPALRSALRKLVRALPEPFREGAESSASAVLVDPGRWGESARPSRPSHLDDLQTAIAVGDEVTLGYTDRGGKPSRRVVQPLGVALKGTVWYLVADTDEGLRTFRVNRVTSVVPTGRPLVRPGDFDLARTWSEIVERVDDLRSPVTVSVMVDPEVAEVLRWMFDRQIALGRVGPDGRRAATISGRQIDSLAAQLAGFGRRVEIISPAAARDQLGRLGRELVEVYSGREAVTASSPDPG